jgi:hypothetical protein
VCIYHINTNEIVELEKGKYLATIAEHISAEFEAHTIELGVEGRKPRNVTRGEI